MVPKCSVWPLWVPEYWGVFLRTQGNVDGLDVGAERVQEKELTRGRIPREWR